MQRSGPFRGVICDMDGVITDTAKVHLRAWKQMFDAFLAAQPGLPDRARRPFTEDDYHRYVDGKPRYDGVTSFLGSRGIGLDFGDPTDPPETNTVCGLGNRKDLLFQRALKEGGAEAFPSSVKLLKDLRARAVPVAVISASRNATEVLRSAGVLDLFDAKVDGIDSDRMELAGKPDPAIFREAARQLGIEPKEAVVFEDALAGVEAGRNGGFGLVVGVDRVGNADALRQHGADIIVKDLGVLSAEEILKHPRPR